MHQSHNIPWHLIPSNLFFVTQDKHYTPPKTGFVPVETPNSTRSLRHLASKLLVTIHTFAGTERQKYPANIPPMHTGPLFSDALMEKYPHYLTTEVQQVETWIERFKRRPTGPHGDLMDVVNVLLAEPSELPTLLMLAQHPLIHMKALYYHSWGHHFGFCRTREAALASYVFFNAIEAAGKLTDGTYALDTQYASLVAELTYRMDFSAQQIPHAKFFSDAGELHDGKVVIHKDYERLQCYLKDVFAVLYRYDVLAGECGIEVNWLEEIGHCYPLSAGWDHGKAVEDST